MNNTYNLFRKLMTEQSKEMNYEQLSESYKKDKNPIYLATAFCKAYKLVLATAGNYIRNYGLTYEDVASYSVEKLDYCLLNYKGTHEAKFTTFYVTVIKNKFREETQALSMQKRCSLLYSSSLEELNEQGWDKSVTDEYRYNDILEGYELTDKEKQYCKLLMQSYTNTEISNILGVTTMTLCNYRKNLRLKLNGFTL